MKFTQNIFKNEDFFTFTIVYLKINMNVENFALAVICQHTLEKIQISFGKSLGIYRVPRQILKADINTGY